MRLLLVLTALATAQSQTLHFGGEIRQRVESASGDEYLLQRYMLHGDLRAGSRFRIFGQLKSGIETGRLGGPRPADEDRADLHQAFAEAAVSRWATLRVGRQELSFGSSRLVSFREGPNVRQSFDGARLTLRALDWQVDFFATKPVETSRGVFDDSPDHTRSFWGAYATRPLRFLPGGSVDAYYLALDRKRARFDAGEGREQRHSAGTRVSGKTDSWDYNTEAVFQWGRFGAGAIRAWTIASDTGFRLDAAPLRPRFGLKADAASGDRNPADRTLGTFHALFPKGAYFSEADLLGPYNLMDLHPSVELRVAKSVTLTPDADFFWRQSIRDGVYGIPGNLIQSGKGRSGRYIGCHASARAEWRIDSHASITALYLRFFSASSFQLSRTGSNVNFAAAWITYRF